MPITHKHPAPGVEEVVEELDRLANIYGWHHEKCAGHSHFPSCPVVKLRRMLVALTSHHQKSIEAVVARLEGEKKAMRGEINIDDHYKLGYNQALDDAITIIRGTIKS